MMLKKLIISMQRDDIQQFFFFHQLRKKIKMSKVLMSTWGNTSLLRLNESLTKNNLFICKIIYIFAPSINR